MSSKQRNGRCENENKISFTDTISNKEFYIFVLGSFNRKLMKRAFEVLFPECIVYRPKNLSTFENSVKSGILNIRIECLK